MATPGGHRVQSSLHRSVGPTPTIAAGTPDASIFVSRFLHAKRRHAWLALRTSRSTSSTVYRRDPSAFLGVLPPLDRKDALYSPNGSATSGMPHAAATTPKDDTYISAGSNILVLAYDLTTLNASAALLVSASTLRSTVSESCLAPNALT